MIKIIFILSRKIRTNFEMNPRTMIECKLNRSIYYKYIIAFQSNHQVLNMKRSVEKKGKFRSIDVANKIKTFHAVHAEKSSSRNRCETIWERFIKIRGKRILYRAARRKLGGKNKDDFDCAPVKLSFAH